MKTCQRCAETLPLDEFYCCRPQRDGHDYLCKSCRKARNREWRAEHREEVRERDRRRRVKNRGRERERERRRYHEDPVPHRARRAVHKAVKAGLLERPAACSSCEAVGPVDGHHHDYSKPLDVEWLCRSCHMAHHREAQVAA